MIEELDYRYSMDYSKIEKDDINTYFDLDKYFLLSNKERVKDHMDILEGYFDSSEEFDSYFNKVAQRILDSIVKKNQDSSCGLCSNGNIDNICDNCLDKIFKADTFVTDVSYYFVMSLLNNKQLISDSSLIRQLCILFFKSFESKDGVLSHSPNFENNFLDTCLEINRKTFSNIESNELVLSKINDILYELETHIARAKIYNRKLYNTINHQIEFFKKELRYYELKQVTLPGKKNIKKETSTNNAEKTDSFSELFRDENSFNFIKDILVDENLIESETNVWIDRKNGYKGTCASLFMTLHRKGYFVNNRLPQVSEIRFICKNSFGIDISKSLIEKARSDNFNLDFIPSAPSINNQR